MHSIRTRSRPTTNIAAVALAAMCALSAGPAYSGTAAEIAQSLPNRLPQRADEERRVPFQRVVRQDCRNSGDLCGKRLTTVGDGERLYVTDVSCHLEIPNKGQARFVLIADRPAPEEFRDFDFFVPVLTNDETDLHDYVLNAQTLFVAEAGARLEMITDTNQDNAFFTCKVVGDRAILK
jgi:hypothetical protein